MEIMEVERRAALYKALGDKQRLAVVDALRSSDRAPSEIGDMLKIERNLLAHHLSVLEKVGLVQRLPSSGDGRRKYLRLNTAVLDGLAGYTSSSHPMSVVFVCTHNSARSQMAAAIWNKAPGAYAESAGTDPALKVHPMAIETSTRHGLDLTGCIPRPLSSVEWEPDLVITVCDEAREQLGRIQEANLHWSIPDPAKRGGIEAFEEAFERIEERISALLPDSVMHN